MAVAGAHITIGGKRVPALAVGAAVSLAAHAGLVVVLGLVGSDATRSPPALDYSRGLPIELTVILEEPVESAPPAPPSPPEPRATTPVERPAEPAPAPPADRERAVGPTALERAAAVVATTSRAASALRRLSDALPDVTGLATSETEPDPEAEAKPAPARRATAEAAPETGPERPERPETSETQARGGRSAPAGSHSRPSPGLRRGAEVLHLPQPIYPAVARRRGWEGAVTLEITVDPEGAPRAIAVLESSGREILDGAAIEAAGRGRFRPALSGGRPVSASVVVPFVFRLE
jgi:protein TonB